jgi:hypothetical protein
MNTTFAGRVAEITEIRTHEPERITACAAARRRPPAPLAADGPVVVIAADHPARGALSAGDRPMAMADRADLLERLCLALLRPGVTGVLGTADVLEDLLLLGALEGKLAIGSMNRGGLAGTVFEMDDRFTGYDAAAIAQMRFDGGKMLLRIDPADPATASTLESCAHAVTDLAGHGLMAMVEPFISHRVDARVRNDLSAEAMIRAISVASGLGATSARTWLKVPVVPEMDRVMAASTLPALLLGGEVSGDPELVFAAWHQALRLPNVKGIVAGRSLLYPADGDVAHAVDTAVSLRALRPRRRISARWRTATHAMEAARNECRCGADRTPAKRLGEPGLRASRAGLRRELRRARGTGRGLLRGAGRRRGRQRLGRAGGAGTGTCLGQ